MRIVLLLLLVAVVVAFQPSVLRAQGDGAPKFAVELVDYPAVIQRGQTLEGHVRIENRGAQRGEFAIQTFVETPYGPAVLLNRLTVSVGRGDTEETPWAIQTGALEAGDYEVTIAVKRRQDVIIAPLRFTVQ